MSADTGCIRPDRLRVAALVSHEGSNMRALHRHSLDPACGYELCLVVSNNSRSGAALYARENGIAFHHVSSRTHPDDTGRDAALLAVLASNDVELVVTAGYMKKVGPQTLTAYAGRIINVHPALLPAFGGQGLWGRHVHEAVLAAGETTSGATVHFLTSEYDEGPVIDSLPVPVRYDDSVESLAARVLEAEHVLLPRVVGYLAGSLPTALQPSGGGEPHTG